MKRDPLKWAATASLIIFLLFGLVTCTIGAANGSGMPVNPPTEMKHP